MKKFPMTIVVLLLFCLSAPMVWGQAGSEDDKKVIMTNEATINSDKLEYSPAFFEDGIVFISSNISKKEIRHH